MGEEGDRSWLEAAKGQTVMKCEMIISWQVNKHGEPSDEIVCGRDAIFCDNGARMCFTCARVVCNKGDILSARGQRRFREIERVVYSLPS
jgi:hypothetical protein